jgi:hypothetical protein
MTEGPIDLREPQLGATLALDTPAGRERVAAVVAQVEAGLPALADRLAGDVRDGLADYRRDLVPADDLRASILHNLEAILVGLAAGRAPDPEELAVRRELGARRAVQGVPIDTVVRAYHLGAAALWDRLVAEVAEEDTATMRALLDAATLVWRWVHEVTDAIVAAHAATVRELEARAVAGRQRFVELLVRGDGVGAEAERLAGTLGFAPSGTFQVCAVRGISGDLDAVDGQRDLQAVPGVHAVAVRDDVLYVVSQGASDTEVVATCRTLAPGARVAVGSAREGLAGARESLRDAWLALSVTPVAGTTRFEDEWLWATLADAEDRLGPLHEHTRAVAADNPHLAEAVRSFAASGFSVSEAARRLQLHANTVSYRLERWEELTGHDPRSLPGLLRSLAALR